MNLSTSAAVTGRYGPRFSNLDLSNTRLDSNRSRTLHGRSIIYLAIVIRARSNSMWAIGAGLAIALGVVGGAIRQVRSATRRFSYPGCGYQTYFRATPRSQFPRRLSPANYFCRAHRDEILIAPDRQVDCLVGKGFEKRRREVARWLPVYEIPPRLS